MIASPSRPRVRRAVTGVAMLGAVALTAAGCGTTVALDRLGPAGSPSASLGGPGPAAQGLSLSPRAGADSGTSALAPAGASTSSGGRTLAAGTTAPAGGTGPAAAARAGGKTTAISPGGPVTVGIPYYTDAASYDAQFGAVQTGSSANEPDIARAVIADINKRGGIAGRRVVPLFYPVQLHSTSTYASQSDAECAYFTQDHHVFAVIDGTQLYIYSRPCLNRAGVPEVMANAVNDDDQVAAYQSDVDVSAMSYARAFQAETDAFAAAGWYGGWDSALGRPSARTPAKIGVLTINYPTINQAVQQVLLPALRRAGHPVDPADVVSLPLPGDATSQGSAAAAIQNSVLKFRSDHVEHVVLVDVSGGVTLLFANDAFSQGYFPRYGGNSGNGFQALLASGSIQSQTLAGAVGAGWQPFADMPASAASRYQTSAQRACLSLMRAAGQPTGDTTAQTLEFGYCDKLAVLRAALRGAANLTLASFQAGLNRIGEGLGSAEDVSVAFTPARHDAAAGFYAMTYSTGCGCMTYTGHANTAN